ncbi:MAG TPA: glycerophosphodiester phosphodiesterase family protein [Bacteroidales bacterium]|nr:glycerophosphodiester phosphodiesterase family protein [Bacteroidales bacterium]HPS27276.1 glycerophosphodiester phosphodiesterase family protein [Bacteroidales bacterium]
MKKPLVVAHRGGSHCAPENTMAAFQQAMELGVDRIELDVQQSKDGVVLVMHDEKINRTTNGKGVISDMNYAQLKDVDAGSKFSKDFSNEKIPLLDEVLHLVNGQCELLVEIKNPGNINKGLEKNVADLIQQHQALAWCNVQSFEYESLYCLHKINGQITLGLLLDKPKMDTLKKSAANTSFISEININRRYASVAMIDLIHQMDKKVFVWTVNKPDEMARLIKKGVDGIITDDPKTLKTLLLRQSCQFYRS